MTVLKAKIAQSQAEVARDQASLKQFIEQLSYTDITSPIDGIVLSRDVEMGDAVSSILVLGSSATLVIRSVTPARFMSKARWTRATLPGLPWPASSNQSGILQRQDFKGVVTKISPMGVEKDNVTTFEVRVSIDNPGGELKAEMTAKRRDHPRRAQERVCRFRKGPSPTTRTGMPQSKCPMRRAKRASARLPSNIGISNGAKTEVLKRLERG